MSVTDWLWTHFWEELFALAVVGIFGAITQGYRLVKRATRSPQRRLEMRAAQELKWQVQVVTDSTLKTKATPRRIQGFYGGAAIGWDIIAANADVHRAEAKPLLDRLIASEEGPRFFCIIGAPGAGKSTLARRIAADLYHRGCLVLHIKENEPEVWHTIPKLCEGLNQRLYVLVDDVFQDPEVERSIKTALPADLALTILATSRGNQYFNRNPGIVKVEEPTQLLGPSTAEKEEVLSRLGKTLRDLTPEQIARFHKANQFLVLMMELTGGEELTLIVAGTIDWLQRTDKITYRAYAYLCLAGQVGVSMPSSLMAALTGVDRVQGHEAAQDLILDGERRGSLRVGHAVIAECAAKFYERSLPAEGVLRTIASAVNCADAQHRRFFAHLLRALAKTGSPLATKPHFTVIATAKACRKNANASELSIWAQFDAHSWAALTDR